MDTPVLIEEHGRLPIWGVVGGWDTCGRAASKRLQVRAQSGKWILFGAATGREIGSTGGRWLRLPHHSEIPTDKKFLRSIALPKPTGRGADSPCTGAPGAP